MKKSLMSLVVIFFNLKKSLYANGRVSVRIFYKNNSISFFIARLGRSPPKGEDTTSSRAAAAV
jgi:hypothetical protein